MAQDWYRLLTPLEDYKEEAHLYRTLLGENENTQTILELGSGAGHNAYYLKQWYKLTLSDISLEMLKLSKEINPECEHVQGDMRTLRLNRIFDAVFVHDAIAYMTTEEDLRRALETAFVHIKPGGIALLTPDEIQETFTSNTECGGRDDEEKSLRYLEWSWDPDPKDTTCISDFVYVLKDAHGSIDIEYDRHINGLFSTQTWLNTISSVGFKKAEAMPDEYGRVNFLCQK